ncbi:hypothetical protein APICC_04522 [Apis cerana cerana]|uniref:Uncharacterized protein n=1 Tax=Apis cerana cerana TaxID=94128 RepID=A0A2A3E5K4_APICC|nr:hypothetical protein APICC_04522 [Apis cerana cerana]
MPSALKDTINHYTNDTLLSFNNALSKSTKGNNKYPKYPKVGYRWKRRTLCAIFNREKYSTEKLENKEERDTKRKTLLDYDGPHIFTNDIDDSDSLKAHVRVKRSKSEPIVYRQDYLKDLANSFPQDIRESIGKNSYNGDATLLDTKREINYIQINEHRKENEDRSKHLNAAISAYENNEDKSKSNNFIGSSSSDVTKVNTLEKKNIKFVDKTPGKEIKTLQKLSLNSMLNTNWQSDENSEIENLPDPMLAVELVRKKRNDYANVNDKDNKEYLREKNSLSFDSQNTIDEKEKSKSNEKKRSILESNIFDKNLNPSDSIKDMNVNLPRIKRKEKDNDGTKTKLKRKKKKHMGKKHDGSNNFLRSVKDVHSKDTNRSKVPRKKKTNKTKNKDKLKKERTINAIDKKSNENNFHHRFVKSKNLIDRRDIDPFFKNIEPVHEKLKTSDKNKMNDDMLKYVSSISSVARKSPIEETKNNDDDSNTGIDENTNALMQKRNEKRKSFVESKENLITLPPQDSKLRIKRDKNAESNHGFLNKEEELKYYENIREPGSEINRCSNRDKNQLSMVNEMNTNRAVSELQNYLNIEENIKNEKENRKIKTRAIDDLCSNVSTACDVFKESPKIVQKCISINHELGSTKTSKILERKVNPTQITNEHNKLVKIPNKDTMEEKRSVSRRIVKNTSPNTPRISRENENESKSNNKWGKWTDWSSCSVTCGKGRQIRWRYCLRDCSTAETEMEEKACQLPACPPGKFLGIF